MEGLLAAPVGAGEGAAQQARCLSPEYLAGMLRSHERL